MNQKIKKKWIEALRSGKYKQGKTLLRSANKFCCLGVLCDIIKNEIGINWFMNIDGVYSINDNRNKTFSEIVDYIEENL